MKDYKGKTIKVEDEVFIAFIDNNVKPRIMQATVTDILVDKADGTPRQHPMLMYVLKKGDKPRGIKEPNVVQRVAIAYPPNNQEKPDV